MGFREEGTPGRKDLLVDFLGERFLGWTLKDVCNSNCRGRRPSIAGEDRAHGTMGFDHAPCPRKLLQGLHLPVFLLPPHVPGTDATSNLHSLVTSSQLLLLWIG